MPFLRCCCYRNLLQVKILWRGFRRDQCKRKFLGKETIICQTHSDTKPLCVEPRLQRKPKHVTMHRHQQTELCPQISADIILTPVLFGQLNQICTFHKDQSNALKANLHFLVTAKALWSPWWGAGGGGLSNFGHPRVGLYQSFTSYFAKFNVQC